jgi:hypothetical protein
MFYAAFDEDTAVLEVIDPQALGDQKIALARFSPTRDLRLLDVTFPHLTEPLPQPSELDDATRPNWGPRTFLQEFLKDFSKPVERDEYAHVDYVPTQVVTEFVRHRLRTNSGEKLDGIRYRSSRTACTDAVVIFADWVHCVPQSERKPWHPEPFLAFDNVHFVGHEEVAHLSRAS